MLIAFQQTLSSSKPKEGTLLFGHIQIKSSFGFLMLSDSDYLMPCIINNATPEQIHMLEDSYILIKHYRVITEIFQESSVANLEYLFMNFSDIVIIKTNLQKHINDLYGQVKPNERVFKQELCFQLIRKSTATVKKQSVGYRISIKNSTEIFPNITCKVHKVSSCLEEEGHYKLLHNVPLFKVHQLVFSSNENGNTIYLDCYLNNWENTVLPLGLIPQMEIRLRNVCPQSKKYLKSTAFTTFEIIGYHAYIHFDTVNLMHVSDEYGKARF
ncbi:hypothetical protein NQ317_007138 [Molorchus minor]|uniref:Uncharacterized protein n=1 Tax=Molorchus minor TaxID=1323400 RepID=A0ABQ9JXM2_9CUCU|nr:hypothetical protein NQ317_007138 [Molorchus minor]